MRPGTRTLLFGVHQFILHPLYMVFAFAQITKRHPDWRECICIAIHDIGYLGARDLDGAEGLRHPERGGRLARWLLGPCWGDYCTGHSGSYATVKGIATSVLYQVDKLSVLLMPRWMYLALLLLGGERPHFERDMCWAVCGRHFSSNAEWYDCAMAHIRQRLAQKPLVSR